jgi:hypothetical protein
VQDKLAVKKAVKMFRRRNIQVFSYFFFRSS